MISSKFVLPILAVAALTTTACRDSGDPAGEAPRDDGAEASDTMERARELARRVIIADGHIDLPYRLRSNMEDVTVRTESGDFDLPRAREGGLDAPFMSIYVPARYEESGGAKEVADELIDLVEGLAAGAPEDFAIATSVDEVIAQHGEGKISLLLGMENGSPLEKSLDNLRHFYDRGIRYITLAHSEDNHICDSSYDDRGTWKGLSPFGLEVIDEMNRLGIMVDISHLSDDAAGQVLARTKAPVIASHSSCRTFTPDFERNISDELLVELAKNGGVAMINFGSAFLDAEIRQRSTAAWQHIEEWVEHNGLEPGDPKVTEYRRSYFKENHPGFADLETVVDHVMHVIEVAGIDHVGFGSDFDGVGDSLPTGLKDVSQYPNLIAALMERGLSDEDLEKICSGNLFRVMRENARLAEELAGS